MIKTVNSFNALNTLDPFGVDGGSSQSLTNTVLSCVYIPTYSSNIPLRIKALFRKGTTNSTSYETQLIWSTGLTISNDSRLLGSLTILGSSSVANLQRNVFFNTVRVDATNYTNESYQIITSASTENDYTGAVGYTLTTYNYPEFVVFPPAYILACARRLTTTGPSFDTITCSYIYIDI